MPDGASRLVTVIDLEVGNLQSVANALRRVGAEVSIVRSPQEVSDAKIVVLPGVGAFAQAMTRLRQQGFEPFLRDHALQRNRPLIGICLGMQLLAQRSHEHGLCEGLGFIEGEVVRLEPRPPDARVPNIGWMPIHTPRPSAMFPLGADSQSFYHVHSYHLSCSNLSDVAATIDFAGQRVVTAVERNNLFGVQFHPEKSQDAGLNMLHCLLTHLKSLSA
jgi:imidazole glycerol-phosphate synthase subunit HisH